MLRKSSRNIEKDQKRASFSPLTDAVLQKTRSAPICGVSNLDARLSTTKGMFDLDPSSSPTSPLDHKIFSNPGGPFVSFPRSPVPDWHPKNTDGNKVGLGLVNYLIDEVVPLGKVFRFPESRKVELGSKVGIEIPGPKAVSGVLLANPSIIRAPKSLPENYWSSLQAPIGCFHLRFGHQKTGLESERANVQHDKDHKLNSDVSESETKNSTSDSLAASNDSSYEFIGSLSISEIEQSEDYTCIISHGPNPRTTRIFGDCILESYVDWSPDCTNKQREDRGEFPWEVNSSEELPLYSSTDFLSFCYSCKKKLKEEDDIHIYRGEKAFCSCECRAREILIEEEMDKHTMGSSDSLGSSFQEDVSSWRV